MSAFPYLSRVYPVTEPNYMVFKLKKNSECPCYFRSLVEALLCQVHNCELNLKNCTSRSKFLVSISHTEEKMTL